MINCHYCDKEVIPNKKGEITVAFIPQTRMTIDFPFCNKQCHKNLMIERGYDKPKTKREKGFKVGLLILENNQLNRKIGDNKQKISLLQQKRNKNG